jgi:carbohydrate-selective porin OprB
MNMIELRLPRALVTAATVGLIVLVAQWLPGSANGGDPLIDTLGGVRSTLDKHGISLGLQSTNELFGNPNGGRAQGATFFGQTALGLGIDLDKAIDLKGGIFRMIPPQDRSRSFSDAQWSVSSEFTRINQD